MVSKTYLTWEEMRMVNKLWIGALCVGFFMMPSSVRAADDSVPVSMEDKMAVEEQKIEKELGISPEQREKMQALRQEFQAKQKALAEELKAKRAALRDELESDNAPNRSKVDGLVADIKALQGKKMDNSVEQVFKMREIFTPEQYKKSKELRKKRQAEQGMQGKGHGKKGKPGKKGKHKE